MDVVAGSMNVTTYFVLRTTADGTATTGATIANIDLQYTRSGALPSAKVDAVALAAANTAHTDNRAIEIDATDQPGLVRVDWPDAAFAAGVREVVLTVKLASSFTEHLRVNLTPVPADLLCMGGDAQSATDLKDFADAGYDPGANKVQGVVLVDTVTTYNGNTPQTGDNFARIGATGSGLTSLAQASALATHDGKLDTVDALLDDLVAAGILKKTTIASDGRSTTSCRLTAGDDNNDAYVGCRVILDGDAGDGDFVSRTVTAYTATNKQITWAGALTEDPVDGGDIYVVPGPTAFMGNLTGNLVGNVTGDLLGTVSTLTTYTGNTVQTGDNYPVVTHATYGLSALQVNHVALASGISTIISDVGGLNDFDPANDVVAQVTLVVTTTNNSDMRGTENAATEAKQDIIDTNVDAILVDTSSLNDGAISELGVAQPSATPTLQNAVMLMYMALRNQFITQTSGTDAIEIYNDADTLIAKKLITDDTSDYTEAKMTSG